MAVMVAAIVVDAESQVSLWFVFVVVWLTLVSSVRFARCLWILAKVLEIVTKVSPEPI
jgi:hypothetical protein